MDLRQSVSYRGLEINGAALGTGRVLRGIAIDNIDYSNVQAVGYTEKRAGSDGMRASDIYLGGRQIDLTGHIYGTTLADLFDWLHIVRSVFSPTSAYQSSPPDLGFLPMYFQQPTNDEVSYPGDSSLTPPLLPGVVPLYMLVRPARNPRFAINNDRQTSASDLKPRPTATPWSVSLLAKDPRVYISPEQRVDLTSLVAVTNVVGSAKNRGDYETPFNIMLIVGAAPATVGSFHVTGLNGVDMTIKIEKVANVIYRWFGDDRVLMTQDNTNPATPGPLILRMDLVSFATKMRKPMVPASINPPIKPFTTPFTYSCTVPLLTGSRLFWSEAFA